MDERTLKWLYDIKLAIEEINSFFDNMPKDFESYQSNQMLKRAVERNLEIIGEAMNRIVKRDAGFESRITDAKAIIGLRNHVIHAYDGISDEYIWSVLIDHLPKLYDEVGGVISEH